MRHISTLIPEETFNRLDSATAALAARQRIPGLTRSHALRAAIERGLELLEREASSGAEGSEK